MIRRKLRLLPAILAFALGAAACDINVGEHGFSMDLASGKATDEWSRTYNLPASGKLEIVNINGVITASASEGGAVEVRAQRTAKASSDDAARELLKKIEIAETTTADSVRIETKVPRSVNWGRSGNEVRYSVKVPRGLSVRFETVNGGVRLENLDGQIVAETTNGGVRGSRLRGSVKASTTNGGVEITMAAVTGAVELETTNGGIELQLPPDTKADLEARCTNGRIRVAEALAATATEQSRRNYRGRLNGGGAKISAETTNGGIVISSSRASTTN
jgi:hypothetical protein